MNTATMIVLILLLFTCVTSEAFQPADKSELKAAVEACLEVDSTGASCTKDGVHISNWDTSSVTSMSSMFSSKGNFNGNISNWDTSKVTSMSYMFYSASSFN